MEIQELIDNHNELKSSRETGFLDTDKLYDMVIQLLRCHIIMHGGDVSKLN